MALALAASASTATAQTLTRLNTTPAGAQPSGLVDWAIRGLSLSRDGRFVAWVAHASLTPDDVNPEEDVYLRDMALGTSRRISVELPGHVGNIFEASTLGVLSRDWNAFVATHPGALGTPVAMLTPTVAQWWIRDPQSSIDCAL